MTSALTLFACAVFLGLMLAAYLCLRLALFSFRLAFRVIPALIVLCLIALALNGCEAQAQGLQVSARDVSQVTASFRQAMHQGGMTLVSKELRFCYSRAITSRSANVAIYCALYDGAAHIFDRGMRAVFSGYGHDPGPGGDASFMADGAFASRMQVYAAVAGIDINTLTDILIPAARRIATSVEP